MANIMDLVNIKNNVHRSGFDLSRRNCFTAKVGEILPVLVDEVLPGDKWRINMREFMRTAPVQTATFGRVHQYYDFYFVPMRLMWDKFPAWVMQNKQSYHAASLHEPSSVLKNHPYFLRADLIQIMNTLKGVNGPQYYYDTVNTNSENVEHPAYYGASKLLSYLGYPASDTNLDNSLNVALNPFPLLAYQKIYQDYFRNQNWEDPAPWTYNLDYIMDDKTTKIPISSSMIMGSKKQPSFLTLRYANYDKDYYNGLLPTPQFGDTAIAGPISGTIELGETGTDSTSTIYFDPAHATADSNTAMLYLKKNNTGSNNEITSDSGSQQLTARILGPYGHLDVKPDSTMGLSILLLRQAEALQRWKEITISGSQDYKDQLQKHWNVKVSDDNSYLCKYLGGIANNLDVSEVINTNLDGDTSQADIRGKGLSASNGNISFESHEFGIIMCVYHVKPLLEWESTDLCPRLFTKTMATDYAIPEFDSIGMQSVLLGELESSKKNAFEKILGYASRYVEYKTSVDQAHGAFESTLKPWIIPHKSQLTTIDTLDFRSFKISADILDNMFGVAANTSVDTDQFYCTAYFDTKVVRNLDRNGLPY